MRTHAAVRYRAAMARGRGKALEADGRGAAVEPASGPDVRAARLARARELVEEVRRAGRTQGRPYDRDVLRLIEAVLEVAGGVQG